MSSTELERYESSSMNDRMEYARMIAQADDLVPAGFHDPVMREINGNMVKVAGMVGPVNAGKVFLAFEYGAMLGLHPLAALMGIHVIEGKPAASAGLISSLVRTAGHRLRVSTEGNWEDGTYVARAELVRADDPEFTFVATWTKQDAERARLLGKDNWQKYPSSMSKARAITAVAREGAEEALLGVHYTPEELGASVDANGELLVIAESDGTPEAQPDEPKDRPARQRRATNGRQGTKRKSAPVDAPTDPEQAPSEPQESPQPAEDIQDAELVDDAEEAERVERERIAEEQMAEQRRREYAEAEEHAKDRKADPAVTPEQVDALRARQAAEVERQHAHLQATKAKAAPQDEEAARTERQRAKLDERLAEPTPDGFTDAVTGQTFPTQEALDEAIKSRHADKRTNESLASYGDPADAPALASAYEVAASEEFEQEKPNYDRLMATCVNQIELRDMYRRAVDLGHGNTEFRRAVTARKNELPET